MWPAFSRLVDAGTVNSVDAMAVEMQNRTFRLRLNLCSVAKFRSMLQTRSLYEIKTAA